MPKKAKIKNDSDDYSSWVVSKFKPALYDKVIYQHSGCGYAALGLLTGNCPFQLRKLNKENLHCSDRFVKKILKKHGFSVIPITKKKLCNRDLFDSFEEKIRDNHVILCCQQLTRKDASWIVYNGGFLFHNFDIIKSKNTDFLNFPILNKYIIWHPNWK